MASVFALLEAFTRKEAAALGFFPCATASSLLGITFFLRILGFRFIHFLKECIHEGIFHLLITADHGIFDLMVGCGCFFCHDAGFQRTIFLQKFVCELVLNALI